MNKYIFFGSSRFSVLVLEELKRVALLPALIVTVPDQKKGRGLKSASSLVKDWALSNNISVLNPETYDDVFKNEILKTGVETFAIASYGKIIPQNILEVGKQGTLNVHPSLLPKYRGATPIASQILSDDREVGVTIMLVDEKVDHGPIIAQEKVSLSEWPMRASSLQELLGTEGGALLVKTLIEWFQGKRESIPQDHSAATFTKKIKKEDGLITLEDDPYTNYLKLCAYDDSVGTYFFVSKNGKDIRVKITDATFEEGAFKPLRVIPEGGKEMSYQDFLRGLTS